jgi:hypothetical protein
MNKISDRYHGWWAVIAPGKNGGDPLLLATFPTRVKARAAIRKNKTNGLAVRKVRIYEEISPKKK